MILYQYSDLINVKVCTILIKPIGRIKIFI